MHNQILIPFCHFIDGLNVDKYSKLIVEAVLTCCLWFNRKAWNRSSTWLVQGLVKDQTLYLDEKSYIRNDKAQDYNDMIGNIFNKMKAICSNGGIKLTLDFGNNKKHDVIAIPMIKFIISDCKGNNLLCERMCGHSVNMKGLRRDCNVSPYNDDNTWIDQRLLFSFHNMNKKVGKSEAELQEYSFLPIKNAFHHIIIRGCGGNIYGGTPAETLHTVLLDLCDYIVESIYLIFTKCSLDAISDVALGIYDDA